jgi:hypothetical protein
MFGVGLGIRVGGLITASGGFDADAQAYFDRVTNAGGTLSTTEKNAVNQLVLDMKSYGIWTSMKAIYPMVGSSAAACAQNLKSSSFTGTFSSGWTFASTGVNGNGVSSYFDTTLIPSTDLSQNNLSGSYYIANNYNSESRDIICTGITGSFIGIYCSSNNEVALNDSFAPAVTPTKKNGLFIFNRISSTQSKLYANNLQTFSNTISSNLPSVYSIKINCLEFAGVRSRFATNPIRFAHFGDGLTDTQASNFYTCVQTFQTTLARNV